MNDGPDVATFAATLIDWQRTHGRHALPWQQLDASFDKRRDAYRVWLAEIMLQQTQVTAVIPFYRRFVERFPDVRVLADASHDDVMQHWSGLGYYSRARNLHATARRVVDDHGGRFPDDAAALEGLPGIGRSTAAAIAAFAYGRRAAILDGNVKRVLARLFGIDGPPASSGFTRRAWLLAEALLPAPGSERGIEHDIAHYTQGLMDLGATLCTPRKPSCLICPFRAGCVAHREGREASLPERTRKKPLPRRRTTVVVIARGDRVLLERRPPVGIWGGLWSLPEIEPDAEDAAIEHVARRLGGTDASGEDAIVAIERRPGFVHGFTHFVLEADVVRVELVRDAGWRVDTGPEATRWIAVDELGDVGLPTPIRALVATLSA